MHADLAADVLRQCQSLGWRIAVAESCTGGLLAAALTALPGSSAVFERGFVTYSNAAKIDLLGVRPDTLAQFGAVSEAVALEMAQGAAASAGAELALSITGVAGPGISENKPEGLVCFAVVQGRQSPQVFTQRFGGLGRAKVRSAAVNAALAILRDVAQRAAS